MGEATARSATRSSCDRDSDAGAAGSTTDFLADAPPTATPHAAVDGGPKPTDRPALGKAASAPPPAPAWDEGADTELELLSLRPPRAH